MAHTAHQAPVSAWRSNASASTKCDLVSMILFHLSAQIATDGMKAAHQE